MARNGTYSKLIEEYFRANPNKPTRSGTLMRVAKCNRAQVSSAISYLRAKARSGEGGLPIETLVRGQSWIYSPAVEHAKARDELDKRLKGSVPHDFPNEFLPEDKPIETDEQAAARLRKLAAKLGENDWAAAERAEQSSVIVLTVVGTSTEGYAIGKDDTGNVFKVVPV
jgi:hypothetical protein